MKLAETLEADDLELGTSDWFHIDQDRIHQFAEATEDRQWIHVDVERARESELGSTIAHGFLLLSLLPKLFFDVVEFTDLGRIINLGTDKSRFMSPVPSGTDVHLKVWIVSARRRSGGILMRIRGVIHRRDTGRRALTAEMRFLAFTKE